jgi:hypothetical protein
LGLGIFRRGFQKFRNQKNCAFRIERVNIPMNMTTIGPLDAPWSPEYIVFCVDVHSEMSGTEFSVSSEEIFGSGSPKTRLELAAHMLASFAQNKQLMSSEHKFSVRCFLRVDKASTHKNVPGVVGFRFACSLIIRNGCWSSRMIQPPCDVLCDRFVPSVFLTIV